MTIKMKSILDHHESSIVLERVKRIQSQKKKMIFQLISKEII
jgi:hypothetical protein